MPSQETELVTQLKNDKIKKPKHKKSFLKNVKQILSDIESDSMVIGDVEDFVSHMNSEKSWENIKIEALLLWVEFEVVQSIAIARLTMAPKIASEEDFTDLLTWMKKLPTAHLSKITFSVTIWKVTADSFKLIPGTLYTVLRPSSCKLYEDGPQFSARMGNFKANNTMVQNQD